MLLHGGSTANWLYIEYEGQSGYINKNAVIPYTDPAAMPYTQGSLTETQSTVNIYDKPDGEVIGTVTGGSAIQIYYNRGDYTYISADDGQGGEIRGYIQNSLIAVNNSFEKRRIGFLMAFGTIGVAVIFLIVKRKFFY